MSKFKPTPGTATASREPSGNSRQPRPTLTPIATSVVSSPAAPLSPDLVFDTAPNPARQFALKCTLIFLYFRFSFVHEFLSVHLHFDTHIMIILGLICYAAWFVAGNIFVAFSDRLAWVWTAFAFWFCVALLMSSWKGGSFTIVVPWMRTIFPLLLLLPAVIWNPDDLRRVMNVIGYAGASTVLFGLVHRDFSGGRMDIGTEGSTLQDPNDFAAHLIMVIPAIAYVFFGKGRSVFMKAIGAGLIGAALLEIMSTGSRGGFVALMLTSLYIIVTGSTRVRFSLLVGLPVLGLLALPFVPHQAFERIASVVNAGDAGKSADDSTAARRALLMASLKATITHPVFGVGPGTFQEYQAGLAAESRQKGMWHETHNGYTQISSECGIPQIVIYLTAAFMMFKSLRRASRTDVPFVPVVARTLMTMAFGWSAAIIFLADGYKFCMLVFSAITIAINLMLQRAQRVAT